MLTPLHASARHVLGLVSFSLVFLALFFTTTGVALGATNPGSQYGTSDSRVSNPPVAQTELEIIRQLEDIDRSVDDVIVECYEQRVTKEDAKRKIMQRVNAWLDLYAKLAKGRMARVLRVPELEFFNRVNRDREPFLQRYGDYLLGDTEALNPGERILVERLIDSVELYGPEASAVDSQRPLPAPPSR